MAYPFCENLLVFFFGVLLEQTHTKKITIEHWAVKDGERESFYVIFMRCFVFYDYFSTIFTRREWKKHFYTFEFIRMKCLERFAFHSFIRFNCAQFTNVMLERDLFVLYLPHLHCTTIIYHQPSAIVVSSSHLHIEIEIATAFQMIAIKRFLHFSCQSSELE